MPDAVQHASTTTLPSGTDLIRPTQARDLRQRLASTIMRLVHTEEVTVARLTDVPRGTASMDTRGDRPGACKLGRPATARLLALSGRGAGVT
jgi:hypothetical protein